MDFPRKCLMCRQYTDENLTDGCKIWGFDNPQGIPETLCGCSSFQIKEHEIYYLLKIVNDPAIYKFKNETLLNVFLTLKREEGYSDKDFKVDTVKEY